MARVEVPVQTRAVPPKEMGYDGFWKGVRRIVLQGEFRKPNVPEDQLPVHLAAIQLSGGTVTEVVKSRRTQRLEAAGVPHVPEYTVYRAPARQSGAHTDLESVMPAARRSVGIIRPLAIAR
jgi:hypothetical protein